MTEAAFFQCFFAVWGYLGYVELMSLLNLFILRSIRFASLLVALVFFVTSVVEMQGKIIGVRKEEAFLLILCPFCLRNRSDGVKALIQFDRRNIFASLTSGVHTYW